MAQRYEQGRLVTIDNNKSKLTEDLFYSFDMLLPLVTLDKHHEEVTHKIDIVRYYFYFHKIMGYILAMIIAAGLSGLITPSGL
ncbi:hypothetical protein C8R11_11523 [Nitrosomonas aestuarii]|nr:hypothetical protein C8R11_11523 [Nitrosomonas aestuarii]